MPDYGNKEASKKVFVVRTDSNVYCISKQKRSDYDSNRSPVKANRRTNGDE